MKPSELRLIIRDSIRDESIRKNLKRADKIHAEKIAAAAQEERTIRENRKISMIKHYDDNMKNLEARDKDVVAHQSFLKDALKII